MIFKIMRYNKSKIDEVMFSIKNGHYKQNKINGVDQENIISDQLLTEIKYYFEYQHWRQDLDENELVHLDDMIVTFNTFCNEMGISFPKEEDQINEDDQQYEEQYEDHPHQGKCQTCNRKNVVVSANDCNEYICGKCHREEEKEEEYEYRRINRDIEMDMDMEYNYI